MSTQHTPGHPVNFRDDYLQAFREARANGRIGYRVLNNPRARMAASETLCMRLHGDGLDSFRREFASSFAWARMAAKAPGAAT